MSVKGASKLAVGVIVVVALMAIVFVITTFFTVKGITDIGEQAENISGLTPHVLKAVKGLPCVIDCFTVITPKEIEPLATILIPVFSCSGTPTPCDQIDRGGVCVAHGCDWDGSACTGTPTSCDYYKSALKCGNHGCDWTIKEEVALKEFQRSNLSLEYFPCNYELVRWATLAAVASDESLSKARAKMYRCLRADSSLGDASKCTSKSFSFYCDEEEYLRTLSYYPCFPSSFSVPDYPLEYLESDLSYLYFGDITYKPREMDYDVREGYVCNASWYDGPPFNVCLFEDLKYNYSMCRPVWKTIRTKEGDCRDFATAAWSLLRAVNFPSDSMELNFGFCELPCPCKVLLYKGNDESKRRCDEGFIGGWERVKCIPDAWLNFANVPQEITDSFAADEVTIEKIEPCTHFLGLDFGSLYNINTNDFAFYIKSGGELFSQRMHSPNNILGFCYNYDESLDPSKRCSDSKTGLCYDYNEEYYYFMPTEDLVSLCINEFFYGAIGKTKEDIMQAFSMNCLDCNAFCGDLSDEPYNIPPNLDKYCERVCPSRYVCDNTEDVGGVMYDTICYNRLCDYIISNVTDEMDNVNNGRSFLCKDLFSDDINYVSNNLTGIMCSYLPNEDYEICSFEYDYDVNTYTCDLNQICSCREFEEEIKKIPITECSEIGDTNEFKNFVLNNCKDFVSGIKIPTTAGAECSLDEIIVCYEKCGDIMDFDKAADANFAYYCDNCIKDYPQCVLEECKGSDDTSCTPFWEEQKCLIYEEYGCAWDEACTGSFDCSVFNNAMTNDDMTLCQEYGCIWKGCTGDPDCSTAADSSSCNEPCTWVGCSETPDCSSISDELICGYMGCDFDAGCSGETDCSDILNDITCQFVGCTLGECLGTFPCSGINKEDICANGGCDWEEKIIVDECTKYECNELKGIWDGVATCKELYPELGNGLKNFIEKYTYPLERYLECYISADNGDDCPIELMKSCDDACYSDQGISSYEGIGPNLKCNDLIDPGKLFDSDKLNSDPYSYWVDNKCDSYMGCIIDSCDVNHTRTCYYDKCLNIKSEIEDYIGTYGTEPADILTWESIGDFSDLCINKTCAFNVDVPYESGTFPKPYNITGIAVCNDKCEGVMLTDLASCEADAFNDDLLFSYCDDCFDYQCNYDDINAEAIASCDPDDPATVCPMGCTTINLCACYDSSTSQQLTYETLDSCSDLIQRKNPGIEMFCTVDSPEGKCYLPSVFGCEITLRNGLECRNPWFGDSNNGICMLRDSCLDADSALTQEYDDCDYGSFLQEPIDMELKSFCENYWKNYSCDINSPCISACDNITLEFSLLSQGEKDLLECTNLENCELDIIPLTGLCYWDEEEGCKEGCSLISQEFKCIGFGCTWAGGCSGITFDCSSLNQEDSCNAYQEYGCTWEGCTGDTPTCDGLSQVECDNNAPTCTWEGCVGTKIWDNSVDPPVYVGTEMVECSNIGSKILCEYAQDQGFGCTWDGCSGSEGCVSYLSSDDCKSYGLDCLDSSCKISWTTSEGDSNEAVLVPGRIKRCNLDEPCCSYLRDSIETDIGYSLTCDASYIGSQKETLLDICDICDLNPLVDETTCPSLGHTWHGCTGIDFDCLNLNEDSCSSYQGYGCTWEGCTGDTPTCDGLSQVECDDNAPTCTWEGCSGTFPCSDIESEILCGYNCIWKGCIFADVGDCTFQEFCSVLKCGKICDDINAYVQASEETLECNEASIGSLDLVNEYVYENCYKTFGLCEVTWDSETCKMPWMCDNFCGDISLEILTMSSFKKEELTCENMGGLESVASYLNKGCGDVQCVITWDGQTCDISTI